MQIENALRCTDSSRVIKIIIAANPGPKVSTRGLEKHRIQRHCIPKGSQIDDTGVWFELVPIWSYSYRIRWIEIHYS